jgi:hypothetical protein
MTHGKVTSQLAGVLHEWLSPQGYEVLHDHRQDENDPEDRLGKLRSWYGPDYNFNAILTDLDMAVVARGGNKVFVLVEIEETTDKPKVILGDVLATLLGRGIKFQGKRELEVGEWTTLVVMARSSHQSNPDRVRHLSEQLQQIKSGLSTPNAVIGRIVVDTFDAESQLECKLKEQIQQALQGHMS